MKDNTSFLTDDTGGRPDLIAYKVCLWLHDVDKMCAMLQLLPLLFIVDTCNKLSAHIVSFVCCPCEQRVNHETGCLNEERRWSSS